MSEIASAFVRLRPDFTGFKTQVLSDAEKQLKQFQTSVTDTEDAVKKAARENISSSVAQKENLRKLADEYALVARNAVKGSDVQVEATKKWGEAVQSLGSDYREAGRSASGGFALFRTSSSEARSESDKLTRGAIAGSGALRSMGRSLAFASGAFIGAAGFLTGVRDSIKAAGDLQSQMRRVDDVFGSSSTAVKQWASTSVSSMGITKAQALDAASTMGTLLKNVGLMPRAAAQMSTKFTQLAVDMAAFKRVSPDVAINALEAALQGRTRSLRQFGIVIDNTMLKAEAMSMGLLKGSVSARAAGDAEAKLAIAQANLNKALADSGPHSMAAYKATLALHAAQDNLTKVTSGATGALTAQQKTLAAHNLILKEAHAQMGSFAKDQGELGIQSQKFHAALTTLEATIGTALLPIVTKYTTELTNWMTKLSQSKKFQDDVTTAVHDFQRALDVAIGIIKGAWNVLKDLTGALGGVKNAIEAMLTALVIAKVTKFVNAFLGGMQNVETAAAKAEIANAAAAAGTATAWDIAMANIKAAMMTLLASTGIGLLVAGISIGIVEIIAHWNTVKRWLDDFGKWIWSHWWVVSFFPIIGQMAWLAGEIIKHWNDIQYAVTTFANDLVGLFTHPIATVEAIFHQLETAVKDVFRGILKDILSFIDVIPNKILGISTGVRGIKSALQSWVNDFGQAGTNAGNAFSTNLQTQLTGIANMVTPAIVNPGGSLHGRGSGNTSATAQYAASALAGGFLPTGATYSPNRADQGRDLMTNPGGPIIAPGSGYLVRNGVNPGGFGTNYPIVHFTSGPYAGKDMYVGHTMSALSANQSFAAGAVLGYTGKTGNEPWNGNASRAGWAEIGFAPGGTPGPFGQQVPFGPAGASPGPTTLTPPPFTPSIPTFTLPGMKLPKLTKAAAEAMTAHIALLADKAKGIAPESVRASVEKQLADLMNTIKVGIDPTPLRDKIAKLGPEISAGVSLEKAIVKVGPQIATLRAKIAGLPVGMREKIEPELAKVRASLGNVVDQTTLAKVKAHLADLQAAFRNDLSIERQVGTVANDLNLMKREVGALPAALKRTIGPQMVELRGLLSKVTDERALTATKNAYHAIAKEFQDDLASMKTAAQDAKTNFERAFSDIGAAAQQVFDREVQNHIDGMNTALQAATDKLNAELQATNDQLDIAQKALTPSELALKNLQDAKAESQRQKAIGDATKQQADAKDKLAVATDAAKAAQDAYNAAVLGGPLTAAKLAQQLADAQNKVSDATLKAAAAQATYEKAQAASATGQKAVDLVTTKQKAVDAAQALIDANNNLVAAQNAQVETPDQTAARLVTLRQNLADSAQAVTDAQQGIQDATTAADDAAYAEQEAALTDKATAERTALDESIQRQKQAASDKTQAETQALSDQNKIEQQNYQDRANQQKAFFTTTLADLQTQLETRTTTWGDANQKILGLLASDFGLNPDWYTNGLSAGNQLLGGLASAFKAAAPTLEGYQAAAEAVNKVTGALPKQAASAADQALAIARKTEANTAAAAANTKAIKDAGPAVVTTHVTTSGGFASGANVNQVVRDALR